MAYIIGTIWWMDDSANIQIEWNSSAFSFQILEGLLFVYDKMIFTLHKYNEVFRI